MRTTAPAPQESARLGFSLADRPGLESTPGSPPQVDEPAAAGWTNRVAMLLWAGGFALLVALHFLDLLALFRG